MKWMTRFKETFLSELEKLPIDAQLSLSGGIESSCIYYGLIELGRKPKCLTFQLGDVESHDLHFTRKICKTWDTELTIVKIPKLSTEDLVKELKKVLEVTQIPRSIDTQVCYTYLKCFPEMTDILICGFYSGALYGAITAKICIKYNHLKKGLITEDDLNKYIHNDRKMVYEGKAKSGKVHNYVVITDFFKHHGHTLLSPLRCKPIFDLFSELSFSEIMGTNSTDGMNPKWQMIKMFQGYFDRIGNHKNRRNLHVELGMKDYFEDRLLIPYKSKSLNGVYPQIMNQGVSLNKFFN